MPAEARYSHYNIESGVNIPKGKKSSKNSPTSSFSLSTSHQTGGEKVSGITVPLLLTKIL